MPVLIARVEDTSLRPDSIRGDDQSPVVNPRNFPLQPHPESDELRLLPVAALHVDSFILDDQPDHVVLTIRVPKEVVRNNIHLLMGLAEESLERDRESGQPAPRSR
jgi:hypothetical protein